jgi:hypothetical protein
MFVLRAEIVTIFCLDQKISLTCKLSIEIAVYFANTRLPITKIERIYINVVVYKTKFHERFYF